MKINDKDVILSKGAVRAWMILNAHTVDSATELVETAAEELELPEEWLDDETHWIWDVAVDAMYGEEE